MKVSESPIWIFLDDNDKKYYHQDPDISDAVYNSDYVAVEKYLEKNGIMQPQVAQYCGASGNIEFFEYLETKRKSFSELTALMVLS